MEELRILTKSLPEHNITTLSIVRQMALMLSKPYKCQVVLAHFEFIQRDLAQQRIRNAIALNSHHLLTSLWLWFETYIQLFCLNFFYNISSNK